MYIIKNRSIHLIIVSFCVYLVLNLCENYIHYNIGRHHDDEFIELSLPSKKDWIKIITVMLIFATLQGFMTYFFNYYT